MLPELCILFLFSFLMMRRVRATPLADEADDRESHKDEVLPLCNQLSVGVEVDLEERQVTVDRESYRMMNLQARILSKLPMHQEFCKV